MPHDVTTELGGVALVDLPKVSLHDHLDGGLRPQTIIELADEAGIAVPVADAEGLGRWFWDQCQAGSLVEYLKTFDLTTAVMQTAGGLERVAREFVEDLVADGVVYGEIRWAPEQHLGGGLTLDETVEAVQRGIDAAVDGARSAGRPIRVGQLVSAMRQNDRGVEIAELAIRHRDRGVVGFDIAGPEAGFPPARLRAAFDLLAANFLPRTVHAGEADGIDSIRGALLDGRAMRLGHGVRIAEDIDITEGPGGERLARLGEVASWVRDREIPLEASPSSNVQTAAFAQWGTALADHPFDLLYQLDFRVTVNTDNRLMSATSLTRELGLLVDAFGYDLDDLEVFQLNAAAGAFLPIEERASLAEAIMRGFEEA